MPERPLRVQVAEIATEIFRDVFNDDDIVLRDEMSARDVLVWDSLNHISLLAALERRFKITFTTGEIGQMHNVGELLDIIVAKLPSKGTATSA